MGISFRMPTVLFIVELAFKFQIFIWLISREPRVSFCSSDFFQFPHGNLRTGAHLAPWSLISVVPRSLSFPNGCKGS